MGLVSFNSAGVDVNQSEVLHKHVHTQSSNIHKQNIVAVLSSVNRLHAVSESRLTEKFLKQYWGKKTVDDLGIDFRFHFLKQVFDQAFHSVVLFITPNILAADIFTSLSSHHLRTLSLTCTAFFVLLYFGWIWSVLIEPLLSLFNGFLLHYWLVLCTKLLLYLKVIRKMIPSYILECVIQR